MRLHFSLAVVTVVVAGSVAWAQQQPQVPPQAPTTVQLPTFSVFTVQTTVSVPDGGGMSLGGIGRSADGSVTSGLGPLRNRALGSARAASGVSVQASIIDHHEIDQTLMAEALAKRRAAAADPAIAKADAISRSIGRSEDLGATGGLSTRALATAGQASSGTPAGSVAAIRAQNAAAAQQWAGEAAGYFAKAQQAEADGKPAVAKVYYQMVVRRDAGQLKEQAQSRLAALSSGKSAAVANR